MTSMPLPFPALPRTPRGHLSVRFYEAVLVLCRYGGQRAESAGATPDAMLDAHPFLRGYLEEVASHAPGSLAEGGLVGPESVERFRAEVDRWETAAEVRLPIGSLRAELGLGEAHVLALILAGLVEEDSRFGAVFSAAGNGVGAWPTVGLLHQIAAASRSEPVQDAWTFARPLVDAGLLEVVDATEPRGDWQLRVPAPLWTALAGDAVAQPLPGVHWRPPASWEPLSELILEPAQRERLREACALLSSGDARALVVRGLAGSERLEVVGAVARALGRGVLEMAPPAGEAKLPWKLIGPMATILGAQPTVVLEPGPGETFEIPEPPGYRGPVGVVLGPDGGVGGRPVETAITVQLPPENASLRVRRWARALPGEPKATHRALAERFLLGGRHVHRAARLARTHAALERRERLSLDDVRAAARAINGQQLDSLATRLEGDGGWEQLVLHGSTAEELHHLERRCRHRERLTTALAPGLPGGMNRGVRALFQGPSGTGKTLAARVLAVELGLDLYRVDLSSVVSKFIGETEKNLSRVLGRAEDLDVILLLDEGDSLMGKRTEVRSSHDRWANMETNYLLQRLDTYTGVVLVTTNLPGSVDPSFQRRMDVVVRFHLPSFEERWHLWQRHLPVDHGIDADVVEAAARRYELTGGQIRNAAVDASLLGLASGGRQPDADDLAAAVRAEYRKAGGSPPRPPTRSEPEGASGEAMSSFLGAIR